MPKAYPAAKPNTGEAVMGFDLFAASSYTRFSSFGLGATPALVKSIEVVREAGRGDALRAGPRRFPLRFSSTAAPKADGDNDVACIVMSAPDSPGQPSVEATSPRSADVDGTESIGRGRRVLVEVLIWGTTVLAIVAIFSVWANRQLFNPDNWADTSTELLENEIIRDATANYLVDQLYENVDVAAELRAKLPEELQPLAAPVAGALRNASVTASRRALAQRQGPGDRRSPTAPRTRRSSTSSRGARAQWSRAAAR